MNAPTKRQLIESLRSRLCPACSSEKRLRQSVCPSCYAKLPTRTKRDLYQHIGCGYEDAFAEAMAYLGVTVPVWPEQDEVEDAA